VKRNRDSTRDFVLQREQIARIAVQPVGPQMCVGLGIDQLGADTHPVARSLDAPFQDIAHSQLATDLLGVGLPATIGESSIPRDNGNHREPRQVGRQVFGDAVGEVLLFAVVAQIDEGQDDNRQPRCNSRGGRRNLRLDRTLAAAGAPASLASELIAAPRNRADQVCVPQGYAECPDLSAQIALFDDPARPDPADQFVLANDRAVGCDQRHKDIIGAPAEFYRPAVGENLAAMRQDPETAELDARRPFGHGIHKH
jgi:hypothetical protein